MQRGLSGLLEVDAPFRPVLFLHIGRAVDLAGVRHAIHQFVSAAARVGFGCCRLCRWGQVGRNDLPGFTDSAHPADARAALFYGHEATIRAAPNAVDGAPSGGLTGGTADEH